MSSDWKSMIFRLEDMIRCLDVNGVKSFTTEFQSILEEEIKGFSYSSDASENVTDMVLENI